MYLISDLDITKGICSYVVMAVYLYWRRNDWLFWTM